MAFVLNLDPKTGIVIGTCSGTLGLEDSKQGATAFRESPEYNGRPVVWDLRLARLELTAHEVSELAQFVLHHPAPSPRVAFVVGRDVDYGQARMFETLRERPSEEVRVFRDYDEAMSWARSPREAIRPEGSEPA